MENERFNYESFDKGIKAISLGKLSPDMIAFICEKRPGLATLLSPDTDIIFWEDRMRHTKLHIDDFISDNEFYTCLESIPDIIHNPDYISHREKDNSISFIKDFSSHVSVAVRISVDGKLNYRTMYPIMDAQLSDYISKGNAWRWEKH